MSTHSPSWIQRSIDISSAVFIVILVLSAIWDPTIRVLHAFQAAIYVCVIALTHRRSAWGYGAGGFIAAFWNWTNLVHNTFFTSGIRALVRSVQTGQITRPDQLIAVFAVAAHFVLIAACVVGFARLRPRSPLSLLRFLSGGFLAIASFTGMILLFGPQYIPLVKRVFGM